MSPAMRCPHPTEDEPSDEMPSPNREDEPSDETPSPNRDDEPSSEEPTTKSGPHCETETVHSNTDPAPPKQIHSKETTPFSTFS